MYSIDNVSKGAKDTMVSNNMMFAGVNVGVPGGMSMGVDVGVSAGAGARSHYYSHCPLFVVLFPHPNPPPTHTHTHLLLPSFPDKTRKLIRNDGVHESTFPDGVVLREYPSGRREVVGADGVVQEELKDDMDP